VTDAGGIDDKSFNATAWKGIQAAEAEFGLEGKYLESQQQTDYEKNLKAFLDEGCNLIVPVGFLLGDATAAAAAANPDAKFSIVDFAYDPTIPNVLGQVFNTDEAAFMAGYLAAGVTKTGKVATFGGIQIPTVTIFMDGFYAGVQYYNAQKGTSVEVLGWDPASQTGTFTGNLRARKTGARWVCRSWTRVQTSSCRSLDRWVRAQLRQPKSAATYGSSAWTLTGSTQCRTSPTSC